MKLKLTAFVSLVLFFTACEGYQIAEKDDKINDTKTETTRNGEKVTIDKDNLEIKGDDGEKVEIKDGKIKVTDGEKEINISKDGVSVKEGDGDEKNPSDGDEAESKSDGIGEKLTLKGVNENKTLPCEGRRILVNGAGNKYTFTGECSRLLVNGTGQKVVVEKVGRIVVNGTGNSVVYSEGIDGKEPKVSKAGVGNAVSKK